MKKSSIVFVLLFVSLTIWSQNRKLRFPVWTTHSADTDIMGISAGFFPNHWLENTGEVRTYGVRIEAFPLSFLYFLAPGKQLSSSKEDFEERIKSINVTQKIYGFNLATGSFEDINVVGVSLTGIIHTSIRHNGIALAGVSNIIESSNGITAAFGGNYIFKGNGIMISGPYGGVAKYFNGIQVSVENLIEKKGNGIQIGLFNRASNFRGLQFGIWNKNDKRSLPLINWQFKS